MKYASKSTIVVGSCLLFTFATAICVAHNSGPATWVEFSQSISHCKKNQFILSVANKSYPQIYKIHGWEDEKCILSIQDQPPRDHIKTGIQYCDLKQSDLNWLSHFARTKQTSLKEYIEWLDSKCEMIY